jgi:hypothetical protein
MSEQNNELFGKAIELLIHDIRNCLNTIIGFSSISLSDENVTENIKVNLRKIFYSGMSIEEELSKIDYYLMDDIEVPKTDFEINSVIKNFFNNAGDQLKENKISVTYLTDEKLNICFPIEIFNKLLDTLFQFSLRGFRIEKDDRTIQIYYKNEANILYFYYTDSSPPVFIEGEYFNFEDILNSRRGLSIILIEKIIKFYKGTISYCYGKKCEQTFSKFTCSKKDNHGFIIQVPLS